MVLTLTGKVAVVSGASRGLGRTYALALAEAGAKVVAMARSLSGEPERIGTLAEVEATARGRGLEVTGVACDLEDEASIVAAIAAVTDQYGGVDILVNNAVWPIRTFNPLDIPVDEWAQTMKVNVRGAYVLMREAAPLMIERGGGSIINITSGAAGRTEPGSGAHDGYLVYGISKAALERLTTWFAAEFRDRGIAVNAVSPGNIATYLEKRAEPDAAFWGPPIVHLAGQRPTTGATGQILHTYEFGLSWGDRARREKAWDDDLIAILAAAGIPEDPA